MSWCDVFDVRCYIVYYYYILYYIIILYYYIILLYIIHYYYIIILYIIHTLLYTISYTILFLLLIYLPFYSPSVLICSPLPHSFLSHLLFSSSYSSLLFFSSNPFPSSIPLLCSLFLFPIYLLFQSFPSSSPSPPLLISQIM